MEFTELSKANKALFYREKVVDVLGKSMGKKKKKLDFVLCHMVE
jgi:hypothetical protein